MAVSLRTNGFQAYTRAGTGSGAVTEQTTVQIPIPESSSSGDVAVLVAFQTLNVSNQNTMNPVGHSGGSGDGWTRWPSWPATSNSNAQGGFIKNWWRVLSATDISNGYVRLNVGTVADQMFYVFALRGADPTNPIAGVDNTMNGSDTAGTSYPAASFTTDEAGVDVYTVWVTRGSATNNYTPPSGTTQMHEGATGTSANALSTLLVRGSLSIAPSSTGTRTATGSLSRVWNAMSFAFKPLRHHGPTFDADDAGSVFSGANTLGQEFYTTSACQLEAYRYWRPTTAVTGSTAALIDLSTGTEVADSRITFTNPPAAGNYHAQALPAPIQLVTNRRYRVAILFTGSFWLKDPYFAGSGPAASGLTYGPLKIPQSSATSGRGQNTFIAGSSFANPTSATPNSVSHGIDAEVAPIPLTYREGVGLARVGTNARASGVSFRRGTGQARHGSTARASGRKLGAGLGRAVAVGLETDAFGKKKAKGLGPAPTIHFSAYAIPPVPTPIFNGRPLPEDPLPLAQSRYLVQNILTGEWLHTDLPLSDDTTKLTLSGPCEISGQITPEYADLRTRGGGPLLRSWGHVIYLEIDGEIRAAGMITQDSYDDQTQSLVCQGISAYPKEIVYQGNYRRYFADPIQVSKEMWDYVQSFRNGNLGVVITRAGGSSQVMYGSKVNPVPGDKLLGVPYAPRPENTTDDDPKVNPVRKINTLAGVWTILIGMGYKTRNRADEAKPAEGDNLVPADTIFVRKSDLERAYNQYFLTPGQPYGQTLASPPDQTSSVYIEPLKIDWWDAKQCGSVIDDNTKSLPCDFVEQYKWNFPRTFVDQSVLFSYPRVGRRREDLRFVQGENIVAPVALESNPDDFATCVVGIGAGEGSASLRETAEIIIPGVVRKTYVYRNSKITDRETLRRLVTSELQQRSTGGYDIPEIIVQASHVNAVFGSYVQGDDIYVQTEVSGYGWIGLWCRILSMTLARGADAVRIALRRSDSFYYGREVESS